MGRCSKDVSGRSEGSEAPALWDSAIRALRIRKVFMTIPPMKEIKQRLAASKLKADTRRTVWCVCVSLFMGSLRGSELLSYDSLKFDPSRFSLVVTLRSFRPRQMGRKSRFFSFDYD